LDNLHVSQGWFDSSVSLGEPGYEERETIVNGLSVAAKVLYGYCFATQLLPIIDNQAQVNFVQNKASGSATQLFPLAL
jgi:dihydroorotase